MGKAYVKFQDKGIKPDKKVNTSVSAKNLSNLKAYVNVSTIVKPTVEIKKSVDVTKCKSKAFLKAEPKCETVYIPSIPVSIIELIQLAITKNLITIPIDCDEIRECINIKDAVGSGSPEDPFIIPVSTSTGTSSYYANIDSRIPDTLTAPGRVGNEDEDTYWYQYNNGHALWVWSNNIWSLSFKHTYPQVRYREIFDLVGDSSCVTITENSGLIPDNEANYRVTDNGQVLYTDRGFTRFTIDSNLSRICITDETGTPLTLGSLTFPSSLEVLFWFN